MPIEIKIADICNKDIGAYVRAADRLEAFYRANKESRVYEEKIIDENLMRYFLGVYLRSAEDSQKPINVAKLLTHCNKPPAADMLPILKELETVLRANDDGHTAFCLNLYGKTYERPEAIFLISELLHFAQVDDLHVPRQYYHEIVELTFKQMFPQTYKQILDDILKVYQIQNINQQSEVVSKHENTVLQLIDNITSSIKVDVRGRARRPAGVAAQILQKNILFEDIDDHVSLEVTLLDTHYSTDEVLCRTYGDRLATVLKEKQLIYLGRDDFRVVPTGSGYAGVHYYFKNQNGLSIELKWINQHPRPQRMTKAEYSQQQQDHFRAGLNFDLDLELSNAIELSKGEKLSLINSCFNISLEEFLTFQTILAVNRSHFEITVNQNTVLIGVQSPELKESLLRSPFLSVIQKNSAILGLAINWDLTTV